MSQPCATVTCKLLSCTSCHCRQQNVSVTHCNEQLYAQLNPIVNSIDTLSNRFQTLHIHETVREYHQKLEQWRLDCYQTINNVFQEKSEELDQCVNDLLNRPRDQLDHIKTKVSELMQNIEVTQENIEPLTQIITQLNDDLKMIELTNIQMNISPLFINKKSIDLRKTTTNETNLSMLSSVYKEIAYSPGSCCPLACNDQVLLIHQAPNLCFIDRESVIIKRIQWQHNAIRDICWSSTLKQFVIVGENNIFLLNEHMTSITNVDAIEKRRWFSCTCSDVCLFLTTGVRGSSIVEFRLSPLITAVKEWKSPNTCTKKEFINGIVYKNNFLALMIKNKIEKTLRLELRSCEELKHIWSLSFDITCNQNIAFRFCSLTYDEWLVADYETGNLLHITNNGILKTTISYKAMPYYICLFASDTIVVSAAKAVNFHKI